MGAGVGRKPELERLEALPPSPRKKGPAPTCALITSVSTLLLHKVRFLPVSL